MTTYSGYFRFNIGDIVRCRGFVGEAPLLVFRQKEERCGDLEGERVAEHQFLEVASDAAQKLGIRLGKVTVVPTRPGRELPCYIIVIEQDNVPGLDIAQQFLGEIDRSLRASNFLYSASRREKVLGPLRLRRIPTGAWAKFIQEEVERRGTGEAQYKHPGLVQDPQWLEQFQPIDCVLLQDA